MNFVRRGYNAMEPFHKKLLLIALLGLILRLAWVVKIGGMGFGTNTDQAGYVLQGYRIANLRPVTGFVASPVYLLFLGGVIKILNVLNLDLPLRGVVGFIQAFIGAGMIVLVALLGKRRISANAGLCAAVILAVWPNQIMATGTLLTERLSTPFALLGLTLLLWQPKKVPRGFFVVCGIVFGLTSLTRSALLLLVPLAIVFAFLQGETRKIRVRNSMQVVLGAMIVIYPWISYTYLVTDQPRVFSTAGGFNLCLGNNDYANGRWSTEAFEKVCPWPNGAKDQVQQDAEMRDMALEWIRENPDKQWGLIKQRFHFTFSQDADAQAWFPTYLKYEGPIPHELVWDVTGTWWQYLLLACALGFLILPHRLRLKLMAYTIACMVFPMVTIGDMRFKDAIVPVLALVAGAFFAWVIEQFKRKEHSIGRMEIFIPPERS